MSLRMSWRMMFAALSAASAMIFLTSSDVDVVLAEIALFVAEVIVGCVDVFLLTTSLHEHWFPKLELVP